jgi:hypothetical protein
MQEDPVPHAEQAAENLQPEGVETALKPEDFRPGESFATYFGRKADKEACRADEVTRHLLQMITRRRQRGHTDAEIAEDLGCTLQELLEHYPRQP